VWECLLYEGEEDETWTPFCGHHYGMAKFHGWKIRGLSGASIACGSREAETNAARPPVDLWQNAKVVAPPPQDSAST
jgi:hypothetical protein